MHLLAVDEIFLDFFSISRRDRAPEISRLFFIFPCGRCGNFSTFFHFSVLRRDRNFPTFFYFPVPCSAAKCPMEARFSSVKDVDFLFFPFVLSARSASCTGRLTLWVTLGGSTASFRRWKFVNGLKVAKETHTAATTRLDQRQRTHDHTNV